MEKMKDERLSDFKDQFAESQKRKDHREKEILRVAAKNDTKRFSRWISNASPEILTVSVINTNNGFKAEK